MIQIVLFYKKNQFFVIQMKITSNLEQSDLLTYFIVALST